MSREIYVFADWEVFEKPKLIGVLRADMVKGREHFSFAYDDAWLQSESAQQIDPELHLYAGSQYSQEQQNFRVFLDSCPDRLISQCVSSALNFWFCRSRFNLQVTLEISMIVSGIENLSNLASSHKCHS